jgi:ABC-2 type transport system ATP-binding protein
MGFSIGRARLLAVATGAGLVAALAVAPAAHAATGPDGGAAPYQSELLHFLVHIGPGGGEACDVVGELFTPDGAGPDNRFPAIVTTNGFGGSYQDMVPVAELAATDGYVALTYSGLGFGGSGCQVTLDDPDYDGEAASQLISFLGGENGIAFTDAAHTQPVAGLDDVVHDAVDPAGQRVPYDARVGLIGGSYGGGFQFATADVDPRVDTMIPIITWNNLDYSLAPNNTDIPPGGGVTSTTPGVAKMTWALLFSADGILDGLEYARSDPTRLLPCPNFAAWVCPGLVGAGTLGYTLPSTAADLLHASVADFMTKIRIPTLLIQGEDDTLFNLNEAVATYQALKAQGTPVQMIWQSWGHSDSTPAPGEINLSAPDPATQYETARIMAWFNHYLKHQNVSTGPGFAYFRNWITYHGIATPAYATAPSYPVGTSQSWYLSGGQSLVGQAAQITGGSQSFVTPPLGVPTSTAPPDAVGGQVPDINLPGTYAQWTSAPLAGNVDVAGEPVLDVRLDSPTAAVTEKLGAAGDLVVFAKIYDVAPDGTASLINGLIAPARIADVEEPVQITLPGIVHRFAAGDRIRVVIAGGDLNYRGNLPGALVSVPTGSAGNVLSLPVVG